MSGLLKMSAYLTLPSLKIVCCICVYIDLTGSVCATVHCSINHRGRWGGIYSGAFQNPMFDRSTVPLNQLYEKNNAHFIGHKRTLLFVWRSLILPHPIFLPETFDSVSVLFLHDGTILGRYHCSWTEVFLKVNFKDWYICFQSLRIPMSAMPRLFNGFTGHLIVKTKTTIKTLSFNWTFFFLSFRE